MDDATPKPLHCLACGGGRVTPPTGPFGSGPLRFLNGGLRFCWCLDCGYKMDFLTPGQLQGLRKRYESTAKPETATDAL